MANGIVDLAVHQWSEDKKSSWVQIMTTGEWDRPQKQPDGTFKPSKVRITPADLQKFKENFDKGVRGVKLFTDIAHKPDDGSVAEWEELEVRGNKLYAKMAWTDEGAKLVKSGKYNYFSPEFSFAWTDPSTGKVHKDVLFGGALTNRPFLKDMERVALSETEDVDMFQLKFADDETYDPDHDGDNDKTANPKLNPDWMEDVRQGITPWSVCTPDQKQQLIAKGITHHVANRAHAEFMAAHPHLKMSEEGVTNSHKSPPKGKPQNKALYADPDNFKYPIDKKHVHAAVDFYNESGMQSKGGYSNSQWKSIGERIAKAAGDGYSLKDGKIETPSSHKMSDDAYDPESSPDEEDGVATPHNPDDTDSGKYNEPGGGVLRMAEGITMEDWERAQNEIKALKESERRHKFTEQVRGWMFDDNNKSGKLLPAQHDKVVDLMMGMTEEQVQKFSEFVGDLPAAVSFSEIGTAASLGGQKPKDDQVVKLAEKYERDEHMEWKEAFLRAAEELEVK